MKGKISLTVNYVPLPKEKEAQWWAAMKWIVEILKQKQEEKNFSEQTIENCNSEAETQ